MKQRKGRGSFMLGMLAGVMLMNCGTAALAAAGGVTFGSAGRTISGRTAIQAGETITNPNGCEIPSTIIYTDEQGGGNTYLSLRAVSELLDIPASWEDSMIYLGYMPSSGGDVTISDSVGSEELWAERPLHRAGAKAGPYTELEPHWPSEDEIEGWNNWTLKDVPMSGNYMVASDFYCPLEDEGYCALSITNTTGRDLVLAVCCPATITSDNFPDTVVPAGETVVRTFYAAPYTGGLSQRGLTFTLRGDPAVVDGKVDKTVSATVSLVSFTPQQ